LSCDFQILRLASRYSELDDAIMFSDGIMLTQSQLEEGGFGSLTEAIFQFSQCLHQMDVDTVEFAMLSAVCLLNNGL